ncbi:MAG: periplasmic heavy metal sensor [Cyclobacteriaceae bacterium]
MSNSKIYKIGFLIMLAVNVTVIGFLVVGRPLPPGRPGGRGQNDLKAEISDRLGLSSEQRNAYFKLAAKHSEEMRHIERDQKEQAELYLGYLKKESLSEKAMGEILAKLSKLESDKISVTYDHFEELKELCDPSQLAQFDKTIDQVISVLLNKGKNNSPPPRDRR